MKVMIVRCEVASDARDRYRKAWTEWSGQLFAIGVRTELLESRDRPGAYIEITRFEDGIEATLADDRIVHLAEELTACCARRQGMLDLLDPVA